MCPSLFTVHFECVHISNKKLIHVQSLPIFVFGINMKSESVLCSVMTQACGALVAGAIVKVSILNMLHDIVLRLKHVATNCAQKSLFTW